MRTYTHAEPRYFEPLMELMAIDSEFDAIHNHKCEAHARSGGILDASQFWNLIYTKYPFPSFNISSVIRMVYVTWSEKISLITHASRFNFSS